MTFAKPEMLWLLAVTAPLLAGFLVWSWRQRQALIRQFVQSRLLAQLTVGVSPWRQKLRLALVGLAALLLLLALARPQYGYAWEEVRQRGLDIVVAIDTSRSMLAADVAPDRLTRAKLAALDLQRLARTDRLALVAFAGTAFLQCPLTLDDNAFQQSLNLLTVDFLPQGGTALGEAIDVGLTAFKDSGSNHRVLVIFSDGEDHDSDARAAAARAAERGVKIFTVGVGTFTGDRLRLVDAQGRTTYVTDEQNQPVVSRLNADLLREIARKTGGDYLPLIGADPMKTLYDARLAPLPKSELSSRWSRQYHEQFQWPLGLAILLLVLEMFLPERRRGERAEPAGTATADPAVAGLKRVLTALALLFWTAPVLASAGGALRDYERGRYRAAEQEYRRLLERRPEDARLHFNAGTAAYAAGEYTSATNHLEAATRTSDPDLLQRAYYNLGNALFRLGEAAEVPELTLTNWQQAVQHYESALSLNPNDRDAEFNRGLVLSRIEELLRQLAPPQSRHSEPRQQQTPQSDQSQTSEPAGQPPPPQPEPQPKPPDSKPEAPPPPAPEKQQPNEPGPAEPQPRQPEPQPDSQPGQQAGEPRPEDKASKDQPAPQSAGRQEGQSTNTNAAAAAAPTAPGQMTREQARQLLEAARLDEKAWQPLPPRDPRKVNRHYRDW